MGFEAWLEWGAKVQEGREAQVKYAPNADEVAAIKEYLNSGNDFFVYSGGMESGAIRLLFREFTRGPKHQGRLTLVLTTYGGDAHAAYRLARILRSLYKSIRLIVAGPCKSAGTLVAIATHEIAFSPLGELGPLDIQVSKRDELISRGSGLDTLQTFSLIRGWAFATFESYMLQIVEKSSGSISTKMACEVAGRLVADLFEPLISQVDPHRLSEVQRMMTIAREYGTRLSPPNLKPDALNTLINAYPAHEFVIDEREARKLFEKVDKITPQESDLLRIAGLATEGATLEPAEDAEWFDIQSILPAEEAGEHGIRSQSVSGDTGSAREDESREPRDARKVPSRKSGSRGARNRGGAAQGEKGLSGNQEGDGGIRESR